MLTPTKPVKSCECGGSCGGCCCCTKESIGLGNVDNTSDLNKPLSTDMVNALNGKVDLDIFTQLKNRVLALENSIPDITALENRVTNAEANIVTLQSNYANLSQAISNLTATVNTLSNRVTGVNDALVTVGTRVDALEAKDNNNVKLSGVNVQTIQGTLKANDPASGTTDKTLVTANWVSQTGDSGPNNLIHKTGNENRPTGLLSTSYIGSKLPRIKTPSSKNVWIRWCEITPSYTENNIIEMISNVGNNGLFYCMFAIAGAGGYSRCLSIINAPQNANTFKVVVLLNTVTNCYEIWIYVGNYLNTELIIAGLKYGYSPRIKEINEEYTEIPTDGYSNKLFVLGHE